MHLPSSHGAGSTASAQEMGTLPALSVPLKGLRPRVTQGEIIAYQWQRLGFWSPGRPASHWATRPSRHQRPVDKHRLGAGPPTSSWVASASIFSFLGLIFSTNADGSHPQVCVAPSACALDPRVCLIRQRLTTMEKGGDAPYFTAPRGGASTRSCWREADSSTRQRKQALARR